MICIEGMAETESIGENGGGEKDGVLAKDYADGGPYYEVCEDEEDDDGYGWKG